MSRGSSLDAVLSANGSNSKLPANLAGKAVVDFRMSRDRGFAAICGIHEDGVTSAHVHG